MMASGATQAERLNHVEPVIFPLGDGLIRGGNAFSQGLDGHDVAIHAIAERATDINDAVADHQLGEPALRRLLEDGDNVLVRVEGTGQVLGELVFGQARDKAQHTGSTK